MRSLRKLKNIEALFYYHAVLSTAEKVPAITLKLEKNGFHPGAREEGLALLEKVKGIYNENLLKKDKLESARVSFSMKKKEMEALFRTHRNKALLVFKNNRRESQQMTITKDRAFEELHDWMLVFMGVARLSLKGSPELFSSLTRHIS
jgi:hypothetical protein